MLLVGRRGSLVAAGRANYSRAVIVDRAATSRHLKILATLVLAVLFLSSLSLKEVENWSTL